jgi:hypothetical protein
MIGAGRGDVAAQLVREFGEKADAVGRVRNVDVDDILDQVRGKPRPSGRGQERGRRSRPWLAEPCGRFSN